MSRALSSPTATAAAAIITQPGHLVELDFSPVLRFSSRIDETWNGLSWTKNNILVSDIAEDASGGAKVTVTIGNTDLAMGAVVLNQAPQGIGIFVWTYYEGALATADPVPVFGGVIDGCDVSEQAVTLQATQPQGSTLFIPRGRISPATGFNRLMPAGRVIPWNGQRITLVQG